MIDNILFIINILIWGIIPFISKMCTEKIGVLNFTILHYISSGILVTLILLFTNNKNLVKVILDNKNIYYIVLLLSLSSLIASYIYYFLLHKYNANFVSIIISPISILLTALIGKYFFNESLTIQMWLGAIIIIIGLLIFLNGKN